MVPHLFKCPSGVVCNTEEGGLSITTVIVTAEIGLIGDMATPEEPKGIGNVESKSDCKTVEWWAPFVADANFLGICKDESSSLFDEPVTAYKSCCASLGSDLY